MRGAFIVRLGVGTSPSDGIFEGWVEEVDSGKEIRFHSTQDLIKFLSERYQASSAAFEGAENSDGIEE